MIEEVLLEAFDVKTENDDTDAVAHVLGGVDDAEENKVFISRVVVKDVALLLLFVAMLLLLLLPLLMLFWPLLLFIPFVCITVAVIL